MDNDQSTPTPAGAPAAPVPGTSTEVAQVEGQAPLKPPRPEPERDSFETDNVASPDHYTRNPHRLTAYIIPFPKPSIKHVDPDKIPVRFLIYTPPPPPIPSPKEGEKEAKVQKVQRKWQNEVREAKTSDAKVTSFKGIKGRVTKGVDWAIGQTKSSNLEFLTRIPDDKASKDKDKTDQTSENEEPDHHAEDGYQEGDTTKKTVGLEEILLVYPASLSTTSEQLREDFISTMMRTKSKADRDAILATGLLPVSFGIDLLATPVWPFGGLVEIDLAFGFASVRGAKISRSVTKRLNSTAGDSSQKHKKEEEQLRLNFRPSPRTEILQKYLAAECHTRDRKAFQSPGPMPTETEILESIGWEPSQTAGETRNWEDEQWEIREVKEDFRMTLKKGAKEWDRWVKAFAKDPAKALKK